MTKQIKHTYFYAHPPQAVWDYLTKPELLVQWLMKNDFEPVEGHDFTFSTNPIPSLDFDGVFYCKVLEVVPLKKLSYSWQSGPGGQEITMDSVVEWTLQPTANGTQLLLEHTFTKGAQLPLFAGLDNGWLKNLQKIDEKIKVSTNDTAKA